MWSTAAVIVAMCYRYSQTHRSVELRWIQGTPCCNVPLSHAWAAGLRYRDGRVIQQKKKDRHAGDDLSLVEGRRQGNSNSVRISSNSTEAFFCVIVMMMVLIVSAVHTRAVPRQHLREGGTVQELLRLLHQDPHPRKVHRDPKAAGCRPCRRPRYTTCLSVRVCVRGNCGGRTCGSGTGA